MFSQSHGQIPFSLVVGDFYSLDTHKPDFELIEKWDVLQVKLLRYHEAVKKTHESLRDLREKFPKTHIDLATIFEGSDPNTVQRQVESWLSDVFGQAVPYHKRIRLTFFDCIDALCIIYFLILRRRPKM